MERKIGRIIPKVVIALLLAGGVTAFVSYCARDSAPWLPDETTFADHAIVAQVKRPEWKPKFYYSLQSIAETIGLPLIGPRADSFPEALKWREASRARLAWIQTFRI